MGVFRVQMELLKRETTVPHFPESVSGCTAPSTPRLQFVILMVSLTLLCLPQTPVRYTDGFIDLTLSAPDSSSLY